MNMYMHTSISSQGRAASFLHKGCTESSTKQFLLLIIYYKILWTYSQDNYMDVSNTSFFLHFLHQPQQPCASDNSIYPLFCTSLNFVLAGHFFSNDAFIPKPFPMKCTSEGSKKDEIWGSAPGLNGGWGITVHLSFVTASCVFKLVFVQVFSG